MRLPKAADATRDADWIFRGWRIWLLHAHKKPLADYSARGLVFKKPRRYLLSRLLHYHRLRKLNYCVRDGNRCGLSDVVTGNDTAAGKDCRTLYIRLLGKWHQVRLQVKLAMFNNPFLGLRNF